MVYVCVCGEFAEDERLSEAIASRGCFSGWLQKSKSGATRKLVGAKTKNYFTLNFGSRVLSRSRDNDQHTVSEMVPFAAIVDAEMERGTSFVV